MTNNLKTQAMKRMISATVLLLMVSAVTFGKNPVATGKTFSPLGDYTLTATDNTTPLKGKDCQTYKLSYENSPLDVTVIICKDRGCKRYVVLSDKLSVQYVCNADYFGVEKLDKAFAAEGYTTSDEELNRVEYFHQKVLGPGRMNELDATKLVAAYFPFLLKNADQLTASR
jgi:hypothetical protein